MFSTISNSKISPVNISQIQHKQSDTSGNGNPSRTFSNRWKSPQPNRMLHHNMDSNRVRNDTHDDGDDDNYDQLEFRGSGRRDNAPLKSVSRSYPGPGQGTFPLSKRRSPEDSRIQMEIDLDTSANSVDGSDITALTLSEKKARAVPYPNPPLSSTRFGSSSSSSSSVNLTYPNPNPNPPISKSRFSSTTVNAPTYPKPSPFAQEVADSLGLSSEKDRQTISLIDKVSRITEQQLSELDAETRAQILEIRRDLKIDGTAGNGIIMIVHGIAIVINHISIAIYIIIIMIIYFYYYYTLRRFDSCSKK